MYSLKNKVKDNNVFIIHRLTIHFTTKPRKFKQYLNISSNILYIVYQFSLLELYRHVVFNKIKLFLFLIKI